MNTQDDEYHSPCPSCLIALAISVALWSLIFLAIAGATALIARLV
jgi:predicted transporter